MNRRYFPGLNALRAFAAFSVIIAHVTSFPSELVGKGWEDNPLELLGLSGWDAVTFFFVLSGFLITYLLLEEMAQTGRIDVRRFYARRSRRILPLYYLVTAVGFGAIPLLIGGPLAHTAPSVLIGVLALLPQFPFVFVLGSLSYMGHLWSIGIEEVFYFAWAFLLSRVRSPIRLIACIVAAKYALQVLVNIAAETYHTPTLMALDLLLRYARFEAMAVGAAAAYLLIRDSPALRILYRPLVARSGAAILIVSVLVPSRIFWLTDLALSVAFAIVILNVSTNPRRARPEHRISFYLGQLTYGMYIWHMPVLYLLIRAGVTGWSLYVWTLALTPLAAWISYHLFEARFLRSHASPPPASLRPQPEVGGLEPRKLSR